VLYAFAMTLGGASADLLLMGRSNTALESFSNDISTGYVQPPDTMRAALSELLAFTALERTGFDARFVALPYALLGCDRRTRAYLVCTSSADNRPVWDFGGSGPSVLAAPSTWELRESATHRPLARLEVGASDGRDEPSLLLGHDLQPPETLTLQATLQRCAFYLAPVVHPLLTALSTVAGAAYVQSTINRLAPMQDIRT
jgi:hypothetical protein